MPAVKKNAKASARKKKPSNSKGRRSRAKSSQFSLSIQSAWSGFLTYAAVMLCVVTIAVVLMLAAGGYFANFGERVDHLSSKAAKAVGFSVRRVAVRGQGEISDRDLMEALARPDHGEILGQSLLNLDAEDMRDRVENIPWVKSAAVQKLWPDTIHVTIIERTAVALWQDQNLAFHLIDVNGEVLDLVADGDDVGLPVLSKTADPTRAKLVLEQLAERPELMARVAAVVSVNDRRFDLRFRNDFTAKLPEVEISASLDRLDQLGAGTGKLSESLQYLDLRNPDWAYFQRKTS